MHKKQWIITAVIVAVVAAAIYGGTLIYAKVNNDAAPEQLALSSQSSAPTTTLSATDSQGASQAPASSPSLAGDWKIATNSVAGYRVKEVLNGQDVTVVGRTNKVTGTATTNASLLTAASITVDMTTLATDNSSRDGQFLSILKTSEFPQATFTLSNSVDISSVNSGIATVKAAGKLSIAGVTKDVTIELKAQKNDAGVQVSGSLPITFADYGISAPNLGFVKVEDAGSIEMLLQLSK